MQQLQLKTYFTFLQFITSKYQFFKAFILLSITVLFFGCVNQTKLSSAEKVQLELHNQLILEIEEFVEASLFNSMISVQKDNRLEWNKLLSIYSCGSESGKQNVAKIIADIQPKFRSRIQATASQYEVFVLPHEKAILADVSDIAFRLFSAAYAAGYARQIELAETVEQGTKSDLCGGIVKSNTTNLNAFAANMNWQSDTAGISLTKRLLAPHIDLGIKVFNQVLLERGSTFEALVYSHAYQRIEEYQQLFFEVNKLENVNSYALAVQGNSFFMDDIADAAKHNEFAYLLLTSGYHWGMMSVLVILEQDFQKLHKLKKRDSEKLIEQVILSKST